MRAPSFENRMKYFVILLAVFLVFSTVGVVLVRMFEGERQRAFGLREALRAVEAQLDPVERDGIFRESEKNRLATDDRTSSEGKKKPIPAEGQDDLDSPYPSSDFFLDDFLKKEKDILLWAVVSFLLAVEVSILLASSLTRPLKKLSWALREVSEGRWVKIPDSFAGFEEVNSLARSFNEMVDQLQQWQRFRSQMERVQRLAAIGETVAGLSHEIKNPLAGMKIHMDLIKRKSSEDIASSINMIERELDRLNQTIRHLLSFAGPQSLILNKMSINDLLDWFSGVYRPQFEEVGVIFESIKPERDFVILGDRPSLEQVLMNFASNSMDALSEGDAFRLEACAVGEEGIVRISDTGTGIAEEDIGRVFDPFFTTKSEGTGLGLSIVYRIIESHGGYIDVDSGRGRTIFTVHFPLGRAKGVQAACSSESLKTN